MSETSRFIVTWSEPPPGGSLAIAVPKDDVVVVEEIRRSTAGDLAVTVTAFDPIGNRVVGYVAGPVAGVAEELVASGVPMITLTGQRGAALAVNAAAIGNIQTVQSVPPTVRLGLNSVSGVYVTTVNVTDTPDEVIEAATAALGRHGFGGSFVITSGDSPWVVAHPTSAVVGLVEARSNTASNSQPLVYVAYGNRISATSSPAGIDGILAAMVHDGRAVLLLTGTSGEAVYVAADAVHSVSSTRGMTHLRLFSKAAAITVAVVETCDQVVAALENALRDGVYRLNLPPDAGIGLG